MYYEMWVRPPRPRAVPRTSRDSRRSGGAAVSPTGLTGWIDRSQMVAGQRFRALLVLFLIHPCDSEPVQRSLTADAHTTSLLLFKEGSGTTVAAEVGPAATLRGASWAIGRDYFAAATSAGYVGVPDAPALRPANELTVETWVKFDKVGGDLICKNSAYMFRMGSSMTAEISVGGWKTLAGSLSIPARTWVHLALTYDASSGVAKTFVNGELDATLTIPGGGAITGTSDLRIGQNDWSPTSSMADAKVDSFRVSNTTRDFEPLDPPVPPPAVGGNLVPNGDFELGLAAGWRGREYGDHHLCWGTRSGGGVTGGAVLQSLPGNSELPVDLLSRPIHVAAGRKYSWSVRLKASKAESTATFSLVGTGSSAKFDGSKLASYSSAPGTTWTKASGSFTVPADFKCPSVAFLINDPGNTTQLSFDEFRLEDATADGAPPPLSDFIGLSLRSALPVGHVFLRDGGGSHGEVGSTRTTSASSTLALSVFNRDPAGTAHVVTVQPVVTNWEGLPVDYAPVLPLLGPFSLQPNGSALTSFTLNTTSIGYYQLRFNLSLGSSSSRVDDMMPAAGSSGWAQLAFIRYVVLANMRGVGDASTSLFAMNTHMERETSPHLKRNLMLLAMAGVKYIRAWWSWGMCEQVKGTFDFTEFERQYEAVTNGTGMEIMPILLRVSQVSAACN
jgi:hypothetical protein